MSLKYWMLSIALFVIILFFAVKGYNALTDPVKLMPDKGSAQKSEARTENSAAAGVVTKPVSAESHSLMAQKNIFSPERKDFQGTASGSASNPAVRPQVILYGVTIANDYQSALVANPGRSLRKGERDLMSLKLGERVGEYKLTKVMSDRITLEAQGDAFDVLLYDAKAPKKRETSIPTPLVAGETTRGTRQVAQGTPTPPSQMPMPSSPSSNPSRIPSPVSTPAPSTQTPVSTPGQAPGPPPSTSQAPAPASVPAQASAPAQSSGPTQIPVPMTPSVMAAPMAPASLPPPPEMGQRVPVPPEMGNPVPQTLSLPPQSASPAGK